MRKKQISTLLIVFAFISIASFSIPFFVKGETQEESSYFDKKWDVERIDGTQRAKSIKLEGVDANLQMIKSSINYRTPMYEQGGETMWYPVIDDSGMTPGGYYWQLMTCIYKGDYGNIWIGVNDDYDWHDDGGTPGDFDDDTWYFNYSWTPDGIIIEGAGYPDDYYLPPGYADEVTAEDLREVLYEFDTNIHDTDVMYFGQYTDRPGPFGDNKTQIFVFNIHDDFFFNPYTNLGFIEGYFWSEIARALNTNAFHMDSYQWWRRQGENPPMESRGVDYSYLSIRAFEYEGTFAHEFQHLINNDVDPDEFSWVDEGMSTLAEYLCGYGFSPGHISEYLYWFWDTPLVIWEGYLADYGASFLWTFYMFEHYGNVELIWDICHEQANGIEGWNNVLLGPKGYSKGKDFDQIFQDWVIANYLDDTSFYGGIYGYYELDIPSANSEYLSIPLVMEIWANDPDFGWLFLWQVRKYPHEGVNYPLYASRNLPYTANYVEFTKLGSLRKLKVNFDGADYSGAIPTSGDYNWHSDGTGDSWFRMGRTFDLTTVTTATLTFWSYFSIEEDYDYGYVEVYNTNTGEWTTLTGLMTVTTLPEYYDNENCPEEFEPTTYFAEGKWNAFTGESGGIYQEVMDLSMFAGSVIELYFTYWTDPYTLGSGWYIDDIAIPEIDYFFNVDDMDPEWTVNNLPSDAGWYLNDKIYYNDFTVNFIEIWNFYNKKDILKGSCYWIDSMTLNPDTEEGRYKTWLWDINHIQKLSVMVVSNQPGYEHTFGSTYSFTADISRKRFL